MSSQPNKIGRYEIRAAIGRGSMGTVFRAYDPFVRREVAVKMLPVELVQNTEMRLRFEREAQMLAQIEHPAIVPIYDFGEQDGQPYIVMRYMGGKSLAEHIDKNPIPVGEVVRIIDCLATGLDKAHSRGIIHRDLKPSNILFDEEGNPFIADFGIAKLLQSSVPLTKTAEVMGTPAYMSPEQVRGESDLDSRTDIYAFGVILFEMLCGKLPYVADTPYSQMVKHIMEPVPDVLALNPCLPPGCQAVIARAMAKRKFARFATAGELAKALTAAVERTGIVTSAPVATFAVPTDELETLPAGGGTGDTTLLKPRRIPTPRPNTTISAQEAEELRKIKPKNPWGRRLLILMGGGIGLILLAGLGLAGFIYIPKLIDQLALAPTLRPTPTATRTSTQTLTPTPVPTTPAPVILPTDTLLPTQTETATMTETFMPTPTNTPTPFYQGEELGGADLLAFVHNNEIYLSDLYGKWDIKITRMGGIKTHLQWAHDGQSILFLIGKCVYSVSLSEINAEPRRIFCAGWVDYLAAFEINPDGTQVAISISDGLYILPYDPTKLNNIQHLDDIKAAKGCLEYTKQTKAVRWSKDGKSIAVVILSSQNGMPVESVQLLQLNECGKAPTIQDTFPNDRYPIKNYYKSPIIESLGWDGYQVFAINIPELWSFGNFYTYNTSTKVQPVLKNPIANQCCYRDFVWSPNGKFILFAFLDSRYAKTVELYYEEFGTLNTQIQYNPIQFASGLVLSSSDKPYPALRQVH